MSCCKKGKTINNLQVPSYTKLAKDILEKIGDNEIQDEDILVMSQIYKQVYPHSPNKIIDKDFLLNQMKVFVQYYEKFK